MYRAPVRYIRKPLSVVLLKKKHILLSQVYYVRQVVKTPTIISNNPVFIYCNCVSSWWQWSADLYKNGKETAQKKKRYTKQYENNTKHIIQKTDN